VAVLGLPLQLSPEEVSLAAAAGTFLRQYTAGLAVVSVVQCTTRSVASCGRQRPHASYLVDAAIQRQLGWQQ
jgi:hypothetical protein